MKIGFAISVTLLLFTFFLYLEKLFPPKNSQYNSKIIIIKECADYKVGDVITYNVNNEYLVTHRIIEKENGNFVTKGDNNNTKDNTKVTKSDIEGKVILNSKLLKFLYKHWLITVLVVLLILIFL